MNSLVGGGVLFYIFVGTFWKRRRSFVFRVKFEGLLPVYPSFDDNYGIEDASSLIVLKTTPPIVAIATTNANVYHSLLLATNAGDENLVSFFW